MGRKVTLLIVMMVVLVPLRGQDIEGIEAVVRLLDSEVEDMDSEEVERLSGMLKRQLMINKASPAELSASGLFSRYQVASLVDYRQRNGEVMSFMELSAVDGFGEDFVARIRPFIALDRPSAGTYARTDNEILLRSALKVKDGALRYSYDARYRIEVGDRLDAAVGISRSLDAAAARPDILSGHVEWRLRKAPVRLFLGDFNARFGQGLAVWNGMSIGSFNSPSSFMRRPSGLASSSSLTGKYAFTGVASELSAGRWILSVMLSAPGIKQARASPDRIQVMPAVNLTYNWRDGQAGLTHCTAFSGFGGNLAIPLMKTSMDAEICIRGIDLFSEVVYDWVGRSPAARLGAVSPVGESVDVAAVARLSYEEYALAVSGSLLTGRWMTVKGTDSSRRRVDGTLSADLALYPVPKTDTQDRSLQIRMQTQWRLVLSESFALDVRLTERIRSWGMASRTDLRADMDWSSEKFSSSVRLNLLKCKSMSFLTYADGAYRASKASLHLRLGLFLVDNWDDRIYAYEKDVTGVFNVPAYYGRGVWTAFMSSFKVGRCFKIQCRAACTAYPFMKEKKPGRAELRLQGVCDF